MTAMRTGSRHVRCIGAIIGRPDVDLSLADGRLRSVDDGWTVDGMNTRRFVVIS